MHENQSSGQSSYPAFTDPIKNANFQSAAELAKKSTGKQIAQALWAQQKPFFEDRAAKFLELQSWATGTQDMNQFKDFMNVSNNTADKAYSPQDWTPTMIGSQFVGTLVESMCANEEYPCVTAIDKDSMDEKAERQMDALFRMKDADNVNALQEAGGMQLEPVNAYVPENELSAKIYFELEDRLPKEVRFEKKLEKNLIYNKYQKVLKRENIYDLIVHNIGATKVEKYTNGYYPIRRCIKSNLFYNFFQNENGESELSYIFEPYKLKVREARTKYGKSPERPDGLTERQIYDIAKASTTHNPGMTMQFPSWQNEFDFGGVKAPYDDYNVMVIDGEIKVSEPQYYVSKTDNFGKENISPKKGVPSPKSEKAEVEKVENERWYRFVYCPDLEMILYWGLADVVITDYKNVKKSYSSYTINIPFNNGRYVPSLFERGMSILKKYQLTDLKQTQLISKLRPSGVRIDVAMARNLDLGEGDTMPWLEVVRFFDQTGNELYSSEGLDPSQREASVFSPTAPDASMQKIADLTNVKNALMMELRSVWGVPNYRDGADVGDRTAAKLADIQNTSSYNVTDFIANANNQLMEETLNKICILEWKKVVTDKKESEDDLINTEFETSVKMRLTAYEREILERNIEKWSLPPANGGMPILTPKDVFKIRNIQNFKLAELYLANIVDEREKKRREDEAAAQQAAEQGRAAAAMQQLKMEQAMADIKTQSAISIAEAGKEKEKQNAMLTFVSNMLLESQKTGAPIPQMLNPVIMQVIENVMIPIVADTEETKKMLIEKMQQEQMMAQQQQAAQQQGINPEEQAQMEQAQMQQTM